MITTKIVGLWSIQQFVIISAESKEINWAEKITGTLLYTENGFMTVSINGYCNNINKILFYSGWYALKRENIIEHKVINALDPSRIGQILIREVALNDNVLTMIAYGDYGIAKLIWKKLSTTFIQDQI